MKQNLLPDKGRFYKANLHMHTTVSDGNMTPEEVKRAYLAAGYSVVAYSDHEVLVPHTELNDADFLALTAFEIAINQPPHPGGYPYMKTYHLNMIAPSAQAVISRCFGEAYVFPPHAHAFVTDAMRQYGEERRYDTEFVNRMIAMAREDGFLVSLNHPFWSLQNYPDYAGLRGLWGVECYNTGCVRSGYPDHTQPLDDLLRQGESVFPLATDDAHSPEDCFGGYVMIKAEQLSEESILGALRNGDFYASTGPEIRALWMEEGVLCVRTSSASRITVSTERREAFSVCAENGFPRYGADFDLREYLEISRRVPGESQPYFRVTVEDGAGHQAWSRAYFVKEMTGFPAPTEKEKE